MTDPTHTQTGVPIVDCAACGRRHSIICTHCRVCGRASRFQRGGVCIHCRPTKEDPS